MYRPADEIKPGDILPNVSRHPVSRVTIFPNEYVCVRFHETEFTRFFTHGGPDYGWPGVAINRPEERE